MKRRTAREKALQALFQVTLSGASTNEAIENIAEDEKNDPFLQSLVDGVVTHQEEIDQLIKENLEKWTLERVANVDKTILRIAVFEMNYNEEVPVNVSIDEAIELAKTFGDEKSPGFINSVLSKIKSHIQA